MADMAVEPAELDSLRARLHLCVGRNLLEYQQIEHALKRLLVGSVLDGNPGNLSERIAKQAALVARMNMGDAVREAFGRVLTATPREVTVRPDPTQVTVSIRLFMAPSVERPDEFDLLNEDCKSIVAQRNDLVHHFLRQHSLSTRPAIEAGVAALDVQYAAATALHERIARLAEVNAAARQRLGKWLASDQGQEAIDVALSHGRVVEVLTDVAQQEHREDGWTFVTTAMHRLRDSVAADTARLKQSWGKDWFKRSLDLAGDQFVTKDEPLPNGDAAATRALYRLQEAAPALS